MLCYIHLLFRVYFVYLQLDELDDSGEDIYFCFDDILKRMISFVRYGRKDLSPLDYSVYKKPMGEKDYVISLSYEARNKGLLFILRINDVFYELNLMANAEL